MDVIVVGAGPAGLATAACLGKRGIRARILDRSGEPGGSYRTVRDGVTLASPSALNGLPGLELTTEGEYTRVPEYRQYLARYAEAQDLLIERATVAGVARAESGFAVTLETGEILAARFVVVATGMWDFPVEMHLDGLEPAVVQHHARAWRGPESASPDERVLVIGGATSGVEIAEEIARANGHVVLSARSGVKIIGQKFLGLDLHHWIRPIDGLPTWTLPRHCDRRPTLPATDTGFRRLVREKKIDVRRGIKEASGRRVIFDDGHAIEVDRVIHATGFRFATPFLPDEVRRARAGHLKALHAESVSWPDLFVVGAPCAAHINSEFLRGIAKDAPLVAARIAARMGAAA
jgi:putative flavoprotein involved in K+ transport